MMADVMGHAWQRVGEIWFCVLCGVRPREAKSAAHCQGRKRSEAAGAVAGHPATTGCGYDTHRWNKGIDPCVCEDCGCLDYGPSAQMRCSGQKPTATTQTSAETADCEKEEFDVCWDALAAMGWCDDRGGAEYNRLWDLWVSTVRLRRMMKFIIRKANRQT